MSQPVAPESQVAQAPATGGRGASAAPATAGSDDRVQPPTSNVELTSPNVELRTSNTGSRTPAPVSRPNNFNLAHPYQNLGDFTRARAELRAALDVAPRDVDVLVNMALVERRDQHLERAIELLVKAIATSPEHAGAHYNLAVLYDENDSLALAFDHYHAFLKYAGPEHASLVAAVQLRVLALESRRDRPGP